MILFVGKLVGEVGPQLKWNWKKIKNKDKKGYQKLRGSVFSLRPQAKTEGKYFTSEKELQLL